jgi:hypothetical protein
MRNMSLTIVLWSIFLLYTSQGPDSNGKISAFIGTWELNRSEEHQQSIDPCLQGEPYDVLKIDSTTKGKRSFFSNRTIQISMCDTSSDTCFLSFGRFDCTDSTIYDTIIQDEEWQRHGSTGTGRQSYRFRTLDTLILMSSGTGRWGCPSYTFETQTYYYRISEVPIDLLKDK